MRVYQYPVSKFPFHRIGNISETFMGYQNYCISPEAEDLMVNHFLDSEEFKELYPPFLRYVSAIFENAGLTPDKMPSFRFHQNTTRYHKVGDAEAVKAVLVPLTPMFGANSLCYESQPGLGDWNIINGKIGDFIVHEGRFMDNFVNNTGVHSLAMLIGYCRVP
jgi:hypothetical protein